MAIARLKSKLLQNNPGRHALLFSIMALALQGCAIVPPLKPAGEIRAIGKLQHAQSLAGSQAQWPQEAWWRGYGDTQLDALIDEALKNSPNLAIARARLRLAGAGVQISEGSRLPQVGLNASVSEQRQSYNFLSPPPPATPKGWNDYGRVTLDFGWELDFWGKNKSALNSALNEQESMQAELAQTKLILSSAVSFAYAELAHLHKAHDTAMAALKVRARTADLFRNRHRHGLETLGSVRQVESRLSGVEAEVAILEERLALQKNAIAALVGAGPDRSLSIERPKIDLAAARGLPQELALELLGRRPDIVAARLRAEAASHRIEQSKAELYPNVNLLAFVGVHSLGLNMLTKSGSMVGSFGPAISLPIFNTKRLEGQLDAAYGEYDLAVASYNATLIHALREVSDVAASRRQLAKQHKALSDSFASAREAHRIVNQRYEGGLSNYLDVLAAEDGMLGAQRALTEIQTRALILDVATVRALGGGYRLAGTSSGK